MEEISGNFSLPRLFGHEVEKFIVRPGPPNTSAMAVSSWQAGAKRPQPSTVAELALSLGVDPGFFVVGGDRFRCTCEHPSPSVPFDRLRSSRATKPRYFGQLALDVSAGLDLHVEYPDVDIPSVPVFPWGAEGAGLEETARFRLVSVELVQRCRSDTLCLCTAAPPGKVSASSNETCA